MTASMASWYFCQTDQFSLGSLESGKEEVKVKTIVVVSSGTVLAAVSESLQYPREM